MESDGYFTRDQAIQAIYPQGLPDHLHYILQQATYSYIWNNLVRQIKDLHTPREYIGMIDGILADPLLAPLLQDQQTEWESLKTLAAICDNAYEAGKRVAAREWAGRNITVFSNAYAKASTRSTQAKRQAIDTAMRIAEEHIEELVHIFGRRLQEVFLDWFEIGYMSYARGQA